MFWVFQSRALFLLTRYLSSRFHRTDQRPWENTTWKQFLSLYHSRLNYPDRLYLATVVATFILIKWCKRELPEYSRSSDTQSNCIRNMVAAGDLIFLCSFSNQRFWLFLCICSHLLFLEKLLYCITLSRKHSWIWRKVYFDAVIIASTY